MVCPVCKFIAGRDSDRVINETEEKEFHKAVYLCRNPHCAKYRQVCVTEEYEVDKSKKTSS